MSQCLVQSNLGNYSIYNQQNYNINQNPTNNTLCLNQTPQCMQPPQQYQQQQQQQPNPQSNLICTNNLQNNQCQYFNYNTNQYSNYGNTVLSGLEKPQNNFHCSQQQSPPPPPPPQHNTNYVYPTVTLQSPPPQPIIPITTLTPLTPSIQHIISPGNGGNYIVTSPIPHSQHPPHQPPPPPHHTIPPPLPLPPILQQQRIQITAAPPYYDNIGGPYAPCQLTKPLTYGYCYGYYGETPCQFIDCDDMEDFMSNEKRKEKSRDAARCRRSRETDLFTELADGLPVRRDEVEQLDKASVMRLAISFLKIHDVIKYFPQIKELQVKNETAVNNKEDSTNDNDDVDEEKPFDRFWNNKDTIQLLNNCLDGFLMILSSDGDITYSSESISEYLGISQIDILGNPVWEYIHQCDHEELKEALNIRKNSLQDTVKDENDKEESEFKTCHRDLFLRFKCTLTSRGRSVNIKSASYKVIHFVGHMIINKEGERILIAVGRPIPHPSNIEIPLGTTTFLTKHSLDMKFTYVDEKMQQELHYKADDLLGKSLYNYHHSCDSESLMVTFKSALSKGQGETCRYRFLGKNGGYCWLVTQATTVYDKQKPQSVVCVNYMISQLENENEIYSYEQFEAAKNKDQRKKILCNNNNINNIKSDEININNKNNTINNNSSNQKQQNTSENKLNKIQQITTNNNEVPIITQTTKPSSSSTATIFNKKLNEQNLVTNFVNQNQQIRENSLSPLRQTLKNFNITKQQQQQQLQQQQQQQQQKDLTVPKLTSLKSSSDINKSYDDDDDNNDNDIVINTNFYLTDPKKSKDINLKNCNINNNNNSNCNKVTINKKISVVDCGSVRQQPQQQQEQQKITTTQFTNNKIPPQPQRIEDSKKPKSVTASVFTQVKPNERTSILLNTNAQFNVASRAQSVTASIFKPISQVTQNLLLTAKQNINNGFNNNNNNGNGIINNRNNNNTNTNNISVDKNNKINNNNINNNIVSGIQQQNSIIPKVQIQSTSTLLSTSLLTSNPPSIEKQRRSEDMNKGYISFTEDSDLTMLKEEPDDLTQLTSSAGDSCLPLDDSTPLFGEMLESLILPDSYSSLLPDEINSLDSQQSNNQNNNCNNNNNNNNNNKNGVGPPIDPFINYRDDTSDTASSPHLLSPGGLSKSPEASSLPSLCSPHSLSQEDEFAFMTMNVEDDIDLSMRAPYIPMNENDDLPLLTDDLMWSTFSEELSLHKDMKDVMQIHDNMTALKNQINQTNHNNCYNSNSNNSNNINNNNSNSNCLTTQLNSIAQSHVQQQQQQHQSTPIIATSILQTTNNINLINNNNNNNNIINQNQVNESSLINLLCNNNNSNNNSNNNDDNIISNKLQSDDDINYKKRKYIEDNLCDSIDAFGPVFNNKGCSNLDCWSVSDLLQLDQENIQFNDKSQNILISNLTNGIGTTLATSNSSTSPILSTISPISTSTGTTTIHVPLITIQNNQKINNQINNNLNNKINLQLKDENHCTKSILDNQIINNNNNNNQNNNNKSTITPRILNSCNNNNNINTSQVNTVKLIPHSTIILNGSNITAANNKRHIIGTATTLDSKRIKCSENSSLLTKTTTLTSSVTSTGTNTTSSTPRMHINVGGIQHNQQQHNEPRMQNVEIQTTPHLLQQLIAAPNPKQQQQQQQQQKDNQRNQKNISGMDNKYQNSKKDNDELIINRNHNNHLEHLKLRQQQQLQQQQQQHSPSNSVLKNLLVSGCDGTSPLPPLITDDENSQESIGINTNQMSPCTYYQRPYNCRNVTAQLIRNCGANPMIGGPTMLPSPPIPSEFFNTTSISNFSSNNENDMSNDSGFDDVGNGNGINKNSFTKLTFNEIAFDLQKQLEMKNKTTTSSMLSPIPPIDINRNYNQQSNDYNQNENYTSEDRGGGGGGTYLNQHNINKRLNTINSGGKYKAVVNRTSSPIESISNQQNYFKNNFDNQSSSSVNNDNIPPLIKSGAGDEKMIIDDNENDVKLTSLPLIDESSTSPFENTFLMDFDDFLTDNWANSLI